MSEYVAGRTFYLTLDGAPTGLTGFITLGIEDTENTVVSDPVTTDILEVSPGSYRAERTVPSVPGEYIAVWYDVDTDISATETFTVVITSFAEAGLYYTTPDLTRAWMGKTEDELSDEVLIPHIAKAQREIDTACGGWVVYDDTGLKFATAQVHPILSDREVGLLSDATAAQVEYRMLMGDDFMVKDQYSQESGPDYSSTGKLRKVGSQSYSLLQQAGLLRLASGRLGHKAYNPLDRYGILPRP